VFGIRKAIGRIVNDQLPDAIVRKDEQEPILRIRDKAQAALATDIDKFYGNGNVAIGRDEVLTFKAKVEENKAKLVELRDGQAYGSPEYERYQSEVEHCDQQLVKANGLQRHIEKVKTGLVEDFASVVKREGFSLVGDLAGRIQDAAATIAGAATKNVQLGLSVSAKDGES